jgi:hypothetical protein
MLAALRRMVCALLDAVAEARYREVERAVERMYGGGDRVLSDELERRIGRLYTVDSGFRSSDDPGVQTRAGRR